MPHMTPQHGQLISTHATHSGMATAARDMICFGRRLATSRHVPHFPLLARRADGSMRRRFRTSRFPLARRASLCRRNARAAAVISCRCWPPTLLVAVARLPLFTSRFNDENATKILGKFLDSFIAIRFLLRRISALASSATALSA